MPVPSYLCNRNQTIYVMNAKRGIIVLGLLSAASMPTWAQQIKGVVIDQKSKETLIGAVVTVDGTNVKAITNIDGNFLIDGLDKDKKYTLYINYVGYKTQKIDGVQAKDADQVIALQPDEQQLKEVTVTAVERRYTDAAMIQVAKNSPVIVSNVSAQEISRTQDTNAGEVIRRVPGVSLIDDALESGVYALSTGNDISREWTQLDEHILSLGVNDKHHFKFGNFEPDLLVGAYGEYRSREYQTRNCINSVALGWTSLVGADGYTPIAGSPLLDAASFAGWTGFDTVSYIGAFDGSTNWMSGWTNFDPQNAQY